MGALVFVGAAGALVAAAAWRDVRPIRGELTRVGETLDRVVAEPDDLRSPERRAAISAQMDDAVRTIEGARARVRRSRAIWMTGLVPVLARQRSGLLTLLDDAASAASTGRKLLADLQALEDRTTLRDGAAPLAGLEQVAIDVGSAGRRFEDLDHSSSWLWGSLGDARRRFNQVARTAGRRLTKGADALEAARSFMGAGGTRRHLVAVQNNAEMRDQGMVLSYAVMRFDAGRLTVERDGRIGQLRLDRPVPIPLAPGTREVFGPIRPTELWQSVNATADFAWSGQAMVEMYRQATGESIDGVIAVDVPGLAALLQVIGPVEVDQIPEPMTADNVGRVLLHDAYEGLGPKSDQGPRRERLSEVTRTVVDKLTTGSRDIVALGRDLGQAAAGGHFRLWSRVPEEERVFEGTGFGGGPAALEADRTFHLAVENRTATKLDYYIKPSVRQDVTLTADGGAQVRTTVVLENEAPQGAEPSYQLGPDENTTAPGDYIAWVLLWGPRGATQPGSIAESGLTLTQAVVPVAAGERREVVFDSLLPDAVRDGRLTLRLVPQARLTPVELTVRVNPNGRHVGGSLLWQGPWDRVRTLGWRVEGG